MNEEKKKSITDKGSFQPASLINVIDIDEYNKEIDEAMDQVKRGEYYTHEQVVAMAKSW